MLFLFNVNRFVYCKTPFLNQAYKIAWHGMARNEKYYLWLDHIPFQFDKDIYIYKFISINS